MKIYDQNLDHKSSKIRSFIMILIILMFVFVPFTNSTSFNTTFNFPSFDINSHDLVYEGDATTTNQVIQLTTNQQDKTPTFSIGRVTYGKPMRLWDKVSGQLAEFTTKFSFVIQSKDTLHGDGFAFFLASNGSTLQNNSGGGNLGLKLRDETVQVDKDPFVAVEFDTFRNDWDPAQMDVHVGIDTNSLHSVKVVDWWWSDINKGRKVKAWISYNSSSKNLSVMLVDDNDDFSPTKNSSSLSYTIDLTEYLPEWITFGFTGATGSYFEIHKIYAWEFSSSLHVPEDTTNQTNNPVAPMPPIPPSFEVSPRRSIRKWILVILAVVGSGGFIMGLVFFHYWRKCNQSGINNTGLAVEIERVPGPRKFSYKELVSATNRFAYERLLGQGGFGRVYWGFLKDINSDVAVKKITPQSDQGVKEYLSELQIISRLRHRNLVQLIGWCREKQEFIIVYEFTPNRSLDFHLFNEQCSLTWEKRYNIALGLASALFYLQEECDQCVLHRDIKSSNVLLDMKFNVKLGDFGLARLVDHGRESQTTILIGTEGYVAPEYQESSKASKESDIYSFGIVALEIACGKKAIQEFERNGKRYRMKLVEWVWEKYGLGNIHVAADPRLCQNYDVEQMERLMVVGLACAHPNCYDRPTITQAIDMLNLKAPLPQLPPEMPVPTYVAKHFSSMYASGSSTSETSTTRTQFTGFNSKVDSSGIIKSFTGPI